jgi:phosphoadenosine phosphosulfate reductase
MQTTDRAFAEQRAIDLAHRYAGLSGEGLLRPMIEHAFPGRLAVVSSFGAESAVLLMLVAAVDPSVPVIFLDTGKSFIETLDYRDRLVNRLGLRDVRVHKPAPEDLLAADAPGDLWRRDPDHCCRLRKVLPLRRALTGFEAWVTGRKRFAGGERTGLKAIEAVDGRIKINPLADWTPAQIAHAFVAADLPRHPLVARGYPSIGCAPCTSRASGQPGSVRAGRWAGTGKTECGIHWPVAGEAK